MGFLLVDSFFLLTFATDRLRKQARAFSSVGLEHLPYKQRVGGSNPSTPTRGVPCGSSELQGFFFSILSLLFIGGFPAPFFRRVFGVRMIL